MSISHVAGIGLLTFGVLVGCNTTPEAINIPTAQSRATDLDPASAEASFWLDQPAQYRTAPGDFDSLWDAAQQVSRDLLLDIDRRDRRAGLLTTKPAISGQWFEPWRRELQTTEDLADSSVATIRRTIQYELVKESDRYVVAPKVLIERQAIADRRVSGVLGRGYFRYDPDTAGSRSTDAGETLPDSYWYAIGRDHALEAKLVELINARVDGE